LLEGENIKCLTSKCVHFNDYVIENCFAFAINTWGLLFPVMHMLSLLDFLSSTIFQKRCLFSNDRVRGRGGEHQLFKPVSPLFHSRRDSFCFSSPDKDYMASQMDCALHCGASPVERQKLILLPKCLCWLQS